MGHSEFVQAWNAGKLAVDVSRPQALQIATSNILPIPFQAAHQFWSLVWILSIPAAFVVMYFFTWWLGLLMLIFLTPALLYSIRTSAMQFMIDYALENPQFYANAVEEGVIRIRAKP